MIDYKNLIDNLEEDKIIQLMTSLGADRYRDCGNCIIFPTICHNEDTEDASMKLYYYKDTHLFYCYTEEGAMSIFKMLKNYYETRQIEYDWYEDVLKVILNCSLDKNVLVSAPLAYKQQRDNYKLKKQRYNLPTFSEGVLDIFIKEYPVEWLNDSITKETMDKYNIKYSISQNKIIIPHYNIDNKLVGVRGRALNLEEIKTVGKYMPVQIEGKWYSHPLSLNLYGLNMNKNNIKENQIAYVFESEKSVMQSESFSRPNCSVASCGSNLNKFQVDLLVRYCRPMEIVVCYDNEEISGDSKYFMKLYNMCKKYTKYCNMSFIYDRNNITPKKASPSDCGEDIFNKLVKGRVKVG